MALELKTPYDELTELRSVLTAREIAELTGLRRETISRARPDSRFQRRTEDALGDLYAVVTRIRSVAGEDVGQLAAILRRPQNSLGERSIADLLKEGKVDLVLESLGPGPTEAGGSSPDDEVAAVLDREPELRSRLGAIERALVEHFGPGTRVERKVIIEYDESDPSEDELYLRVYTDLPFGEEVDGLAEFRRRNEELLDPVRGELTIGFLG